MQPYQEKYAENVRQIVQLSDFYGGVEAGFSAWYAARRQAEQAIVRLRAENLALLQAHLFPMLDDLHNADAADIRDLEQFAAALMDWKTNLDCGLSVLIHDSLLSLYRYRRDRDGIIKELYNLGMGLYYQDRAIQGVSRTHAAPFYFRNEMVFTEAGSYLKFFDKIENEQTKGYIIRALANIAICSLNRKHRVAVSSRILNIVQDDYYRKLAPGLPWETFRTRTVRQMSSNRDVLSKGDLGAQELAAVLEACQEVFRPETLTENPNVRWLWPYYEMEYSCGFVDLATTMERMERLIEAMPAEQHDVSGLYSNIQLPVYYGRLLKANPSLQGKPHCVHFLDAAYRKMLRCLMTIPSGQFDDFFFYNIILVVTDYFEMPGVPTYRHVTELLLARFSGPQYLRQRRVGAMLRLFCEAILAENPDFFSEITFLRQISDLEARLAATLEYAEACGLYYDFGLLKMQLGRVMRTRSLLEDEFRIYQLHTVAGYDDLRARASTAVFADIAYGHHRWYDGSDGYPDDYERTGSEYRQMTDLVSLVVYLAEQYTGDFQALRDRILSLEGRRFSPMLTAFLGDEALCHALEAQLAADDAPWYAQIYPYLLGRE